ncbi:uncharacterized protein LOC117109294 [Anneissia japonica]|uniref:uncharacterized protein LOC117109294 n=1 Tax=Anneissia japonica TaxID=1529436 RepID=UPI001425A6ED|nr:uncharacterized protein LOC117109294 [Anneissia japonica]
MLLQRRKTPLDDYNFNECREYEETTRSEKKQSLRKLLIELSVPGEIKARGETAVKAFEYEMQNGEITVVNARFMFMGKEGAGKTSCVNQILGKAFNENEEPTDGVVTTTVVQTSGKDCSEWKKSDVDVAELTNQIKDDAIAENIAKKLKQPESQRSTSPTSTSSLMVKVKEGTSVMTLNERENSQEPEGAGGLSTNQSTGSHDTFEKKLPDRLHKLLVNILANEGPSNVDGPSEVTSIWDYAGQLKYYITHRIYLTGGASYGVVFSLLDDLNDFVKSRDLHKGKFSMTNLEMILFWMRSIFEHAVLPNIENKTICFNDTEISSPPISLIATHKDQLSKSEAETRIKTMYQTIFDAIKGTAYETHVDRTMYAVDNTAKIDEGIEKLKTNVGGYMKAMARTVPTNWVDFQSKVQELGKRKLRVSLEEITTVAIECGIAEDKLTTVLDYLNDTGTILYSKTNEKLKNTVITNLHMMIDFLTKIITVVKPNDIDIWPTMMPMWNKLDNEGVLEEELLRHLWRLEIEKDAGNFEVFIELMKMFGLLFEKQMGAKQGYRTFIVPSRLQVKQESLEVKKDEKQTISIYVTPTDFLPDSIYNTLVVAFLDLMAVKGRHFGHVKLFQNCSEFDVDDNHLVNLGAVKIGNRHALKLEVSHRIKVDEHDEEEALEPHSSICMEVLNYLRQQLKTVYGTIEGVGYELRVLCNVCDPTLRPLHKLDERLKNSSLVCGRKLVATTRFKRLFSTGFDAKSAEEIIHFLALQTLIVGRGSKELREYFLAETKLSKHEVRTFLKSERECGCLRDVDFGDQTENIFSSADKFEAFDMKIMLKLIRYCCNSKYEEDFWKHPPADDNTKLANLVRIYHYKNTVLDSRYSNRVTKEEFEKLWNDLTKLFEGAGVPIEEIEKYRNPRQYKEGVIVGFNQTEFEEIRNFQALFSVIVDLGAVTMRKYILDVNKIKRKTLECI